MRDADALEWDDYGDSDLDWGSSQHEVVQSDNPSDDEEWIGDFCPVPSPSPPPLPLPHDDSICNAVQQLRPSLVVVCGPYAHRACSKIDAWVVDGGPRTAPAESDGRVWVGRDSYLAEWYRVVRGHGAVSPAHVVVPTYQDPKQLKKRFPDAVFIMTREP